MIEFDAAGIVGGIINGKFKPADVYEERKEALERDPGYKSLYTWERRTIRMQCFPVYSILMAIGNPVVDYFSLDIEGAELPVLRTIPFDKVDIK